MDNMISFAIYQDSGQCIHCEGIFSSDQRQLDELFLCLNRTIDYSLPAFHLYLIDNEHFHCIRTENKGFIGKSTDGKILIAQKSGPTVVIFLGQSDFQGSYLHNITRALQQHINLNNQNENIDHMDIQINNTNTDRIKG